MPHSVAPEWNIYFAPQRLFIIYSKSFKKEEHLHYTDKIK